MMNIAVINFTSLLAIDADEYIEIYKKYDEYFSNFSIVTDILRDLGWLILKGLLSLTSMLNILLDKAFDFINFLDSDEVNQFFNMIKPFIWTVLLFAIVYLAYCYLYAHEKPKGVITNVLIFAVTVTALPYLMTQMNQFVTYGKEVLSSNIGENSYELLVPYITDLVYLDSIDFDSEKIESGSRNGFTDKNSGNIQYLNVNEVVDPGDYKLVNEKLFKQQISSEIKKGKEELTVKDIKKSKFFFKDTTPYYYRYHINFFIAALYLLALILVMAFSSVKLIQLVYELVAEKIMAPFIAAGDLTGGQKIRKALIGILNGYITILCVLFLQRLFIISIGWINTKTWSDNAAGNGFIKTVMIVSGALFIIDGPNFFEQIFGVDAGLKSVGQALQSAYYASQMIGGVKRAVTGIAGKIGGAAKGAVGAAAGAAGALGGMKDTGALKSNNEKVSQGMSVWFGPQELDPSHALGSGSEDAGANGYSELPGGGQPGLPGSSSQSAASSGKKTGNPSGGSPQGENSGIPGGNGKQNLAGSQAGKGADVNNAINDALNNMSSDSGSTPGGSAGDVPDNDNLASWAMRNTKAGRYLSSSYEKGRSLGRAAGNTINNRNRKKENKESNANNQSFVYIKPPDEMNKDNLKK